MGNSLGHYIEIDKRSWQSEQAKFMRVRVDLPIDKALRRGGNMVNGEGGKFWVTFKYERLPTFCFWCGKLGHDERHCSESLGSQNTDRQYGDWLRANGNSKNGVGKFKASSTGGYEDSDARPNGWSNSGTSNSGFPASEHGGNSTTPRSNQNLNNTTPAWANTANTSEIQAVEKQVGLDKPENPCHVPDSEKTQHVQQDLLMSDPHLNMLSKDIRDESSVMGLQNQQTSEAQKVTSHLKPKEGPIPCLVQPIIQPGPAKGTQRKAKGSLKKIAREKGQQAQGINMQAQDNIIGLKRSGRLDLIEEEEYRPPKKVRETQLSGADGTTLLSAAAASQRHRE